MSGTGVNQRRSGRKSTPVVHFKAGADSQSDAPAQVLKPKKSKVRSRAKRPAPARSTPNVAAATPVAKVAPTDAAVPPVAAAAVAVVVVVAKGNDVVNGDDDAKQIAPQAPPAAVPVTLAALAERRRALEAELADVQAALAAQQAAADAQKENNKMNNNNNALVQQQQHAVVAGQAEAPLQKVVTAMPEVEKAKATLHVTNVPINNNNMNMSNMNNNKNNNDASARDAGVILAPPQPVPTAPPGWHDDERMERKRTAEANTKFWRRNPMSLLASIPKANLETRTLVVMLTLANSSLNLAYLSPTTLKTALWGNKVLICDADMQISIGMWLDGPKEIAIWPTPNAALNFIIRAAQCQRRRVMSTSRPIYSILGAESLEFALFSLATMLKVLAQPHIAVNHMLHLGSFLNFEYTQVTSALRVFLRRAEVASAAAVGLGLQQDQTFHYSESMDKFITRDLSLNDFPPEALKAYSHFQSLIAARVGPTPKAHASNEGGGNNNSKTLSIAAVSTSAEQRSGPTNGAWRDVGGWRGGSGGGGRGGYRGGRGGYSSGRERKIFCYVCDQPGHVSNECRADDATVLAVHEKRRRRFK
jgi:hypothetical protein